ncbi:MAG: hypothetical protein RI924_1478 [Bacteroidota bacterium]|jgi:hypothetical protein
MKRYRQESDCLNCGATVNGKFCSACGQENIETREPFWIFLFHSIGHYFHFDSKFINSLKPLITQPGKLTLEHIRGKRASYFPPVTMYLFISLFFFLLLSIEKPSIQSSQLSKESEKAIKQELDSLKKVNTLTTLPAAEKQKNIQRIRKLSMVQTSVKEIGKGFKDGYSGIEMDAESPSNYKDLNGYEQQQKQLVPAKRDSWLVSYFTKKNLILKEKYGDELLSKVFEAVQRQLPKMMFVLLPLFALILSLSFYNSTLYFIDHLVYTLHVHSFIFLLFITIELIALALPSAADFMVGVGLIASIWYIYRSMRTVYQRLRWHTVFKFMLLSFIYLILLIFSFAGIFALSFITL